MSRTAEFAARWAFSPRSAAVGLERAEPLTPVYGGSVWRTIARVV
jgi:hypothetical protein